MNGDLRNPRRRPALVVLAAGLGSRYGGAKQLERVGPGGATLMDYSIHDAVAAGFGSVVFVIRPEMERKFDQVLSRYRSRLRVSTVHQRLGDVPSGTIAPPKRVKPWGTAHAVLVAEPETAGPFAVVNADDFYGAPAFRAAAEFLRSHRDASPPAFALVGYRLGDTLSKSGPVNRAICRTDPDGWLLGIEEVAGIERATCVDLEPLVSMNLWAFTPAIFGPLRRGFREFLAGPDATAGEYLLPSAVQEMMERGEARVRVLDPGSQWFGLTYPADRPAVAAALRRLTDEGHYPERLWR